MQRINIKGTISQKNLISGVVVKSSGRGDHYCAGLAPPKTKLTVSKVWNYEEKEIEEVSN